jgi:integrase
VSAAEIGIVQTKGARLLEHFGHAFDCQRLDRARIDGYVDARRALGASDSTIGKELGKLYEALRVAGTKFAGDIAQLKTDVLGAAQPRDRWLDDPEYDALLQQVWHTRRDYVIIYCVTGVRYGELYRIEARHLDRAGRRLWVLGTKGDAEYRERWVPLSPDGLAILSARAKQHPTGPLFPDVWLKPNMRVSLARACRRAGIEPVTANDLRRTFASWCCRRGVSERECQRFMGHSPASMLVRKVYAQLAPEAGREAVASFPSAPEESRKGSRKLGAISADSKGVGGRWN